MRFTQCSIPYLYFNDAHEKRTLSEGIELRLTGLCHGVACADQSHLKCPLNILVRLRYSYQQGFFFITLKSKS